MKKQDQADTLTKIVLVLFMCLLSFSIGTFVGSEVEKANARAESHR